MRDRFQEIYATNEWLHGSGEGSLPEHNRGYIRFLEKFIRREGIASVVDLGCGDWQFSRLIDWRGVLYDGYDIVPAVIDANRRAHAGDNIRFHLYDGDPAHLPGGDLLVVKDVLQHWSDRAVDNFLPVLDRYRFALITNCVNPHGVTKNRDIPDGGFRYLDLRLEPFNLSVEEVFSFTNRRSLGNRLFGRPRWLKRTLLHRSC